jgi:hypothetical protein
MLLANEVPLHGNPESIPEWFLSVGRRAIAGLGEGYPRRKDENDNHQSQALPWLGTARAAVNNSAHIAPKFTHL